MVEFLKVGDAESHTLRQLRDRPLIGRIRVDLGTKILQFGIIRPDYGCGNRAETYERSGDPRGYARPLACAGLLYFGGNVLYRPAKTDAGRV